MVTHHVPWTKGLENQRRLVIVLDKTKPITPESIQAIIDYIEEFGDDTDLNVVKSELQEILSRSKGVYDGL